MQEYGWLHWDDFRGMTGIVVPNGDQRKVRLAACAIVRRLAERIRDPRTVAALAAAEEYADFRIRRQDLRGIAAVAGDVVHEFEGRLLHDKGAALEEWGPEWMYLENDVSVSMEQMLRHRGLGSPEAVSARLVAHVAQPRAVVEHALWWLSNTAAHLLNPGVGSRDAEAPHCGLLRDIFGNPFHPIAFDPSWRTEAVVGLARGMYESRDFGPMPVLADALEDAGCADADVLTHCRGPGPHVRGCWVVDLVLGKS